MSQFDEFKQKFNSSSLSAEALAEEMHNVDSSIIDYAKTCKNGEMTTSGFKKSSEGMSFSAQAGQTVLKSFATVGNMAAMWLVSKGIELTVTAFGNYIHQTERAREATKESIRQLNSISAEVESLEGKIADLNEEILRLNPITDADDIKNLKMETAEMSAQLAIMKEQKRLEGKEADSNAQKSLGKLQGSWYAVVESYETVVNETGLPFVFPILKPKNVTQYQELEIAFK